MRSWTLLAQPSHHLEPVDPRKHQIEDDKVGALAAAACERLDAVPGHRVR